jgi:hypothetical protein
MQANRQHLVDYTTCQQRWQIIAVIFLRLRWGLRGLVAARQVAARHPVLRVA